MRNQWFPQRLADYVPVTQLKKLKAEGVPIGRDTEFGVQITLQEEVVDPEIDQLRKNYVRPVEVEFLTVRGALDSIYIVRALFTDERSRRDLWSS
jgi:hypothetical protein